MDSQRFPAQHRLRKQADFDRVYARRCSASDGWLLIYVDANGLEHSRLGLSVSRKVGGAVLRNRWKRLLREAFRMSRCDLPVGLDLIVIPRSRQEPELEALREALVQTTRRAARRLAKSE